MRAWFRSREEKRQLGGFKVAERGKPKLLCKSCRQTKQCRIIRQWKNWVLARKWG